ncbi:MAG: hypothetical protein LBB11_01055 [Puniceicoccales bacterium]|nr:hypothetical protein [Puniceicoccales bacterium]
MITIFSSFAVSAVSEVQVTPKVEVQDTITMFQKSGDSSPEAPDEKLVPGKLSKNRVDQFKSSQLPVQELKNESSAIKQEEKLSSSPNEFYNKIIQAINNNSSDFREIRKQEDYQDYFNNDCLVLLAKINLFCGFDDRVKLYHCTFFGSNGIHGYLDNTIKKENTPPIMIKLDVNKDIAGFLPYFFKDLTIYCPTGSRTVNENYCQSSKFSDNNIRKAFADSAGNLGTTGKWKNGNAIYIQDWKNCWREKRVLFFVCYDGKVFIVVPAENPNDQLDSFNRSHWQSSARKMLKEVIE